VRYSNDRYQCLQARSFALIPELRMCQREKR
jgi:hypothetical protein